MPDIQVVTLVPSGRRYKTESHLSRLRKVLRGGRRQQKRCFDNILKVASELGNDVEALHGLIRLLGRSIQGRSLGTWMRYPDHSSCWDADDLLFPETTPITQDGRSLYDLMEPLCVFMDLSLATDTVLPWPGEPQRLAKSLRGLKPNGAWGEWRQDWNHSVVVWKPLNVGWVNGGNHSMSAGIAYETGRIKPEAVYDNSSVKEHV